MKLRVGDQVFLQKIDMAHILHDLRSFPAGIFDETFSGNGCDIFIMSGPADGLRFDCAFKDPKTIQWIMDQDWILDYTTYAGTPTKELATLFERLITEFDNGVKAFNAENEAYRKENFDAFNEKFEKERHKIDSIQALIDARNGKVKFVFPAGSPYESVPVKKPNLFQRLFGRSAQ